MTLPFIRLTDPKSGRPRHIDISGLISISPDYDDPNTTFLIIEGAEDNVFTFVVAEDPDTVMAMAEAKIKDVERE